MDDLFYFAELDDNYIVIRILAGENCKSAEDEISKLINISGHGRWIQTYKDDENHRYAMIGGIYDRENNVFIDKKPDAYPSWLLQSDGSWAPPIAYPSLIAESDWPEEYGEYMINQRYYWDEGSISWALFRPQPQ